MKERLSLIAIFALAIFLIPMIALGFGNGRAIPTDAPAQIPDNSPWGQDAVPEPAYEEPPLEPSLETAEPLIDEADVYLDSELDYISNRTYESTEQSSDGFRILDLSTGHINEISARDYVRGAVAAEMPVSFHAEALKAQAVAAHTYALHNQAVQAQNPDPDLKGADFSADPSNRKGYMTEATAKEFYGGGEMADFYWAKICEAADAVLPYVMEYDNEPIVAAYHAISAGTTEDAANVWIGEAPYLQPVESDGCLLAPGYETVVELDAAEARRIFLTYWPDMDLGTEPTAWFENEERSDSGYLTSITVGGVELHGKDLREAFELRSHNIEIDTWDDELSFTVYGYGHGVGLSQYGADFLARQGYLFDEILETYYTGVTIVEMDLD